MLNIFASVKNYLIIALGVLVGGLAVALSLKSAKNDKLKVDVKLEKKNVKEVISALREQESAMRLNDEANKIDEDIKRSNSASNRDRLRKYARNKDNKSADV